jgi:uncharacterized membrane protein
MSILDVVLIVAITVAVLVCLLFILSVAGALFEKDDVASVKKRHGVKPLPGDEDKFLNI